MAVIKTIEKGESLTFGFVLPETYNIANLQAVKIYIGSSIYEHKMDGRTVRVELESNQTALITGRNIVHFVIDDAVFGIKKINCGELEVLPTQATHKDESINTGYDVEIVLSINVETVSVGSVLYDTLKGDKGDAGTIEVGTVTTGDAGTDVVVENVGTPSEAVLNFTMPRGDAGYTPYIGENGNWFINGVDTGVQAEGDATQQWVIDNFVVKESGKSLIADTEIARLATVTNQTLGGLGGEAAANKQDSLAVDGHGVKFPTVDAVNAGLALKVAYADSLKYYPIINYGNRVLSDSGVINDLEKLTKLYVENLKLLDNTVFLWSGDAGIKTRTSGVNTYAAKAYDMSAGNKDAVQATEANQPFVGGGIAPNEKRRIKANSYVAPAKSISHQSIQIGNNNPFTVTYVFKHNNANGSILNSQLVLGGGGIRLGNSTIIINTRTRPPKGSTVIIQFVGDSSGGRFYMNGVSYPVTTYNPANIISLTDILSDISGYQFDGEIYHYSVFNKALSASEIQSQHAYLRLQHPEIEGINIGNQHWATSNYEGVVTGDGTVIPEVQDAAAWADLTTPAWCYYNNDPLNGAVYGKLYNWYAVQAIADNPPQGWRVPTRADFLQLANYLGGTSVAGGKMKKEGLTYWNSPNTGATNESGFSAIGVGRRNIHGTFERIGMYFYTWDSSKYLNYSSNMSREFIGVLADTVLGHGLSIRLIRNEPVGATERTIETGYITNALGATNLDIPIPFGYQVESVRIDSETNITGLSAKLYTGALTELETLFTAKSVIANVQKVIAADADQSIQQTDAVVRINGTKANTAARFRAWIKLTKVVFS